MYRTLFIILLFMCASTSLWAEEVPQSNHTSIHHTLLLVHSQNPTILAAREQLGETLELKAQARSGWLPTISAEASLFATDISSSNFSNGTGATTKDYLVSLNQPIWRGGRTFAENARAKALINAGHALLSRIEQDVFFNAVRAYTDVIQERRIFTLREENVKILEEDLKAAKERKKLGEITKTDVDQANTRLLRSKSTLVNAKTDLDIAVSVYEEIVGQIPPQNLVLPDNLFSFPETIEEMSEIAYQHNPEILIAHFEQLAAEHEIDVNIRELFPQISAFASANRQYDPQPGIIEDAETETIGIRATLALYQGGATRSRIREARKSAERRKYEAIETQKSIRQSITENWRSFLASEIERQTREEETKAAKSALHGVREESRLGQRTTLDVLDANEELIDAQVNLARAYRNEIVAKYALATSLGFLTPHNLGMDVD